jgi:hypothetical protein
LLQDGNGAVRVGDLQAAHDVLGVKFREEQLFALAGTPGTPLVVAELVGPNGPPGRQDHLKRWGVAHGEHIL